MAKTRIPDETWTMIDAEYAQGASVLDLSARYGISKNTIKSRFKRIRVQGAKKRGKTTQTATHRLSPRRQRLAKILPFAKTKTEAGEEAGFARNSARRAVDRAMQDTGFRQAVEEAQAELLDRLGITSDWVASRLKEVTEKCLEPVEVLNAKGKPVLVPLEVLSQGTEVIVPTKLYRFDSRGANAALAKLAELRGMTRDAKEGERARDFVPLEEVAE